MLTVLFKRRLISLLAVLMLLSGCAVSPPQERPCGRWETQRPKTEALQRWTIAGKVSLRTPQQNDMANVDWQQQAPDHYRIMISGPFGLGRNTLEQQGDRAMLSNSKGTFQAASPEELMQQQLGWSLPISSLYYWARALPAPHQPYHMTSDACGYPATIDQLGWHIEYGQWTFADGYWLPSRMKMYYGQLTATLLFKEWSPERYDVE